MKNRRTSLTRTPRPKSRGEQGFVLIVVFVMILVLTTLAALGLSLSGVDFTLSALRTRGAESLYIAEGGAVVGRAALMAYMNVDPIGVTGVDPSLDGLTAVNWYANGIPNAQNPLAILDYLVIDGQSFAFNATPGTPSVSWKVDSSLAFPHLKLATPPDPATANPLGSGGYTATVTLTPNKTPDPLSCAGGPCAIHRIGQNWYEIFYTYVVTSNGTTATQGRRRVTLSGNFSIQLRQQTFAQYALFTDSHTTPSGSPIWFITETTFNGPVHTNTEFRFAAFPTFKDSVTSVSTKAWYSNGGSPIELAANENVSGGVRIDAPLVPPLSDPQTASPANFSRGAPNVPLPTDAYSQEGVSIGRNPVDTSPVTTAQITGAIPELTGSATVPDGIYVPVKDTNNTCLSDGGKPLAGGIFVQGTLDSLTMSYAGPTNNLAVYTLHQGSVVTTVTINRANNQTTVSSNGWLTSPDTPGCPPPHNGPSTRTFTGVPKGWNGPGNDHSTMIYVQGDVGSLSGTLQQDEQTTLTASGDITITGNILYKNPPNPADPSSNPMNLFGIFSANGDIVISASAPNDLTVDAVLMAGSAGSSHNSSMYAQNYDSEAPRGRVHLLGGLIEKYYGPFGTFDPVTHKVLTGYGRDFTFDTRMNRGFAPPYFPTTNLFEIAQGQQHLAGVRPTWREGALP